jgi:hypothetical protein
MAVNQFENFETFIHALSLDKSPFWVFALNSKKVRVKKLFSDRP